MYLASSKYLEASNNFSRNPKSKVVIDNIEYTGLDYIKDHPKISHECLKMIGEFPTKVCKFTMFNLNNIDVLNKEIEVFRGLVLDDNTIEYIPQGIFLVKPDDIKTNSSSTTLEFEIKDKSILFDDLYGGENNISYPTTISNFINEIVTRRGMVLETPNFPFSEYILVTRPNFDINTTSERSLIAAAAELGGCIAQTTRSNSIRISKPQETNKIIKKIDYKSLSSKESKFGLINVVTLGKKGMNDNIQYRNEESILTNGLCEWIIEDNPFVDLIREQVVDAIGLYLDGMSIIPFELLECIDNYTYDLNDCISIEDKQGNIFKTTILSINSANRIFTNFKAEIQNSEVSRHNLAGSSKQQIESIKLDVDHVKIEMNIIATKTNGLEEQSAEMKLDINSISSTVTNQNNEIKDQVQTLQNSTSYEIGIIKETLENGVEKVKTKTGFTFDDEGLKISKSGEEMNNTITNEGIYVKRDTYEVLGADTSGVRAENITVRKYLTIGDNSRLENYKGNRTGCFSLE